MQCPVPAEQNSSRRNESTRSLREYWSNPLHSSLLLSQLATTRAEAHYYINHCMPTARGNPPGILRKAIRSFHEGPSACLRMLLQTFYALGATCLKRQSASFWLGESV